MKILLITLLSIFLLSCQPSRHEKVSTFYASPKQVIEYELPAPLKNRPEQILRRTGYTTSYNRDTRNPNWVAWHLTKAHTYGSHQRSKEVFTEDMDVTPRATDNDYYTSRYDRGHMCPAGDNKWDATAMSESFLFTNICPQNHALNKYEWNKLEIQCREWARQYGAVDIVCGPVYDHATPTRTIGRGHVWVPDAFFKVVLCRSGQPKAIGFLVRNDGKKVSLESLVRTVDDIERLTGIDFFPALDDKVEKRIEAEANMQDW
jgi:DNA/RNA endonuclease G, NUC1